MIQSSCNIDTVTSMFAFTMNMNTYWSSSGELPGTNKTTYAILINIGYIQICFVFDDASFYYRAKISGVWGSWGKIN